MTSGERSACRRRADKTGEPALAERCRRSNRTTLLRGRRRRTGLLVLEVKLSRFGAAGGRVLFPAVVRRRRGRAMRFTAAAAAIAVTAAAALGKCRAR